MTRNLAMWMRWTQVLLDEFFSREDAVPYRHLERQARSRWHTCIAFKAFRQQGQRILGLRLASSALRLDAPDAALYVVGRLIRRS